MCGIVYAHSNKAIAKKILKKYNKQRNRGNEGFGFIAFSEGNIKQYRRYQNEKETIAALKQLTDTHILFHHRYPTSTENVAETAHPIKVTHAELSHDYYVIHNGVISNSHSLKEKHEKLGYVYTTELKKQFIAANGTIYNAGTEFNDTESLAIELSRNLELETPIMATGSAAFIVLKVNKGGRKVQKLIFGTNGGNPLMIENSEHSLCIASEGGGVPAIPMTLYTLDVKTNDITTAKLDMPSYASQKTTIGYNTVYSSGYSSPYDYEYDFEDKEFYTAKHTPRELEKMLEEIEKDIKIAEQCHEEEEVEDLKIERDAIEEELLAYSAYNRY